MPSHVRSNIFRYKSNPEIFMLGSWFYPHTRNNRK